MKSQCVSENINSSSSNHRKSSDFIEDLRCDENQINLSSKDNVHVSASVLSAEGNESYNHDGE